MEWDEDGPSWQERAAAEHDAENGVEYGLVMPFVAVASKGGTYDDDAYAAGWEVGHIDEVAAHTKWSASFPIVREANLAQIDLIAMRYGLACVRDTEPQDGWLAITLSRGAAAGTETPK